MTYPASTYRLQFRNGMDFGRARQLVPYLCELGISHLYASPIMTAATGSTHGYDMTRADEIDPALGGLDGLRALAGALHERGIGLILDIAPNHMAASLENPWWRSVVTWGAESPFSHHFDIDWSQKLTLPFLGKGFEEELSEGAIRLALDPERDVLALRYYDSVYPLNPQTYRDVLDGYDTLAITADPKSDPDGKTILSSALTPADARPALERHLAAVSADPTRMAAIHAAQPWRLTDWRTASRHLSYRRFFEIAGLVGLRVAEQHVFDDSHRLILDLVQDGTVDGLRIDHIDGLADPQGYLERLRTAVGPDVYIVVEKILEKSEPFATEWPVQGTTGYEFITALADALVDEREGGRLAQAFQPLKGEEHRGNYGQEMRASKRQMLSDNFTGEVRRVTLLAKGMADHANADLSRSTLAEAICALIIALPVYRTYLTATTGITERDRQLLASARLDAQEGVRPEVREAIDFIWELLADDKTCNTMPDCVEFRTRFQQLTGPIMAKALEDTLFYRENAFIALNEVGGDPGKSTGGPAAFHAAMQARAEALPHSLSATSTHDTKRGEDARARLYTLSEASDRWIAATQRWSSLNARFRRSHGERQVPEPDVEWLIYQALAGIWPTSGLDDPAAIGVLGERMKAYIEKALREAKIGSNWAAPDIDYEKKAAGFVDDLLRHDAFLDDFNETLSPFINAGLMNSLAQTLIKLTAPGIPDIYQGSERSDFSLVDPDNRPLLDVVSLRVPEKPQPYRTHFMDYKQWLAATVLAARNERSDLFTGPYMPLGFSDGDQQALAFLRGTPEAFAITIVPRLTFGRTLPNALCLMDDAAFGISLLLPPAFEGRAVRSVLDGRTLTLGRELPLAEALASEPVALLLSD
ncbi:malto-oligosyltrehalose synthase [Sinorhizobium sp. RAC02]|uniref:malto-oligosyltrehalose synthase n=1 Tax=Sinorhizobium sp. RAC02 TaxID=1842534 RepID=UPI00083DA175|nr:malto-oligosyltrehalose synthase [Sinorhizobium sp. RAC02]AOF90418.1 malto-oligosyltrehalose synthase [Sinorhizobium sp. RAC02]